jgi:hypothetical protein
LSVASRPRQGVAAVVGQSLGHRRQASALRRGAKDAAGGLADRRFSLYSNFRAPMIRQG